MCAAMGIAMDGSGRRASTSRRRFGLRDAMIFVAATAIGSGLMLSIARQAKSSPYEWCSELIRPGSWSDPLSYCGRISCLCLLTMPLVAAITLALVPIRLVGPRPRFRGLARQPGLMASCASGVAIAFVGLPVVVGALAAGVSWDDVSRMLAAEEQTWSATSDGGLAILVSWMTLSVGGGVPSRAGSTSSGGRWVSAGSWRHSHYGQTFSSSTPSRQTVGLDSSSLPRWLRLSAGRSSTLSR
jgi:hypothetical protein